MSELKIIVVDDERDLWAFEEPPEPLITVTHDGGSWVVYGDEYAEHPKFEEQWWPGVMYGGGSDNRRDEAVEYAKRWAKAVRGVYEII